MLGKKKRPTSYLATSAAYTQFQTLKWIGIGAGTLFILGSIFTLFFLYRNVYIPIGTTENLDITEPLQVQVIDFRGLDNAEKAWREKAAAQTKMPSHDPFYPASTSTSAMLITTTAPQNAPPSITPQATSGVSNPRPPTPVSPQPSVNPEI